MKFTIAKKVGVTVAALALSAAMVGGSSLAANAYTAPKTVITGITNTHGKDTHGVPFTAKGVVSPARPGIKVRLYGNSTGAYKLLGTGVTLDDGSYSIKGTFAKKGNKHIVIKILDSANSTAFKFTSAVFYVH
jgi:hypothetical protein